MKTEDLLYHLQHPESLDQLTLEEINRLITAYPYLESLKLVYEKKQGHGVSWAADMDLQSRLDLAAVRAYRHEQDGTALEPPVFDLPVDDTRSSNGLNGHEMTPNAEPEVIPVLPVFQLYAYEASEFIRFLENLPPCTPEPHISLSEHPAHPGPMDEVNRMIEESLDLKAGTGSESLADLWALQGQYREAISLYERLSFEFPEKSATFAAKIEKLKAENSL